ncbi:MAG: prepilin peptidase [Acidimicrobiia bacterium]|nr:prepilin peptidase [Acidimicrobiia bacterium]
MPTELAIWLPDLFFVLLGAIIGSFLNVCIARIPAGKSVVLPNSRCPNCDRAIRPYDNIPVLSYLMLNGRCRFCREPISWQYPVVEALTALSFWTAYAVVGLQWKVVVLVTFFSAMIVLIFIDLNHRILPDVITKPGIVAGLAFSFVAPVEDGTARFLSSVMGFPITDSTVLSCLDSLIGALVCGGFLWAVAEMYYRIRHVEGLGFGDVKLMGMVGAFLGVRLALLTIMLGSFIGAVIGLAYIKLAGKDSQYELPFGSFLGIAAIVAALRGAQMIGQYTNLFQGL